MTAVMETPAARTLVKRLERAGVADTDNESTAAWIDTLHAYEQVMAKEVRMVSFRLTSQAPEETITEEAVDAAAYERLAAAVAAFDAHGTTAREMIGWLGRWLDIIAALPADAGVEAHKRGQRYLSYRYGKLPLLPPLAKRQAHHWPFAVTLQGHEQAGWRLAVECRTAWRVLTPAQQIQAVADWGAFTDDDRTDRPLWRNHYPADEQHALDQRASALGVDPRPRAVARRGVA
ncbi:MAG: hypothetical protein ACTHMJ_24050 [Thermomicrobiales bacterium]